MLLADASLEWCSSRRPGRPLPSSWGREAEGSTPSPPTGGSLITVRSSIGQGYQPLKLTRRVRFPHGLLAGRPTRRVAELVDARASDARAPEAWEFESPPGDCDCGWAGARPSLISSERWVRHPDPQLFRVPQSMARYANWHRGQVESLVPVGSNPTRATGHKSSRRLAAKTPALQAG